MKRCIGAVIALAIALMSACSPDYPQGPSGTVTGRDATYHSKTGGWFYMLTVDGTEFRVTRDEYKHCFRGSTYPTCAKKG